MGNMSSQLPFTSVCLGVSRYALCGMPFLAGFYSRDLILEMVSSSYVNLVGFLLFFVSTRLTVCYSFRLFYCVFCGDFNSSTLCLIVDDSFNMVCGIVGLILFAVFGGRSVTTSKIICKQRSYTSKKNNF
jgi:NADH-ubiquinone oxidoreductase chain 5